MGSVVQRMAFEARQRSVPAATIPGRAASDNPASSRRSSSRLARTFNVSLSSIFSRVPLAVAALRDILHPGTRRLRHLVVRAAALFDIAVAEAHRDIVGQLRHLKAFATSVATMRCWRLITKYEPAFGSGVKVGF